MEIYDPILVGRGIDYLFIWYLGENVEDKYAIVDEITCMNPYYPDKEREIDILQPPIERFRIWNIIKNKYNIIENPQTNYKLIN